MSSLRDKLTIAKLEDENQILKHENEQLRKYARDLEQQRIFWWQAQSGCNEHE